jgi:hypothetical protein
VKVRFVKVRFVYQPGDGRRRAIAPASIASDPTYLTAKLFTTGIPARVGPGTPSDN